MFYTVAGTFTRIFSEPLIIEEVLSTQDIVKQSDFEPFKPLIAKKQLAGRGRKGNKWYSPPEAGLYLSFKIPKNFFIKTENLSPISLVCGLSVAETVDSFVFSRIKWPNDVFIGNKKVAGILIETNKDFITIGIGVNLNTKSFPPELKHYATSIFLETQREVNFFEFTQLLLENLSRNLLVFRSEGFEPFVELINRKLLWKGKRVIIDRRECGKLLGVNPKGLAVIKTCYGKIKEFPYGDISLRKG